MAVEETVVVATGVDWAAVARVVVALVVARVVALAAVDWAAVARVAATTAIVVRDSGTDVWMEGGDTPAEDTDGRFQCQG